MKYRFTISFIVIFIGIILSIIGIYNLDKVNKDINLGVKEFEESKDTPINPPNAYHDQNASTDNNTAKNRQENIHNPKETAKPIALVEFISNNGFKCAVYNHVCKESLRYGAGRLLSSSYPCSNGNCVLYGHRDSSFKTIENIKIQDTIKVTTKDESVNYTVYDAFITEPHDPKILKTTKNKELTLVTCYPFYFVGPAPKRYVIRAHAL